MKEPPGEGEGALHVTKPIMDKETETGEEIKNICIWKIGNIHKHQAI